MKNKFKIKLSTILSYAFIGLIFITIPFIKTAKSPFEESRQNYKAIIEVWQIDTFEGGVGSRTSFLRNVASNFTKNHPSVLFLVSSHTVNSAKTLIEKGKYPDVISYGGNCLDLSGKIINLKGYSQIDGGILDKNRYMLAWCKGGYFEIKRQGNFKIEKVIVSEGDFNSGSIAKTFTNYSNLKGEVYIPTDAFNAFLIDKNSLLIGTQRDVIRLKNREIQVDIKPINDYCDLYQYLSVIDKGDIKNGYSMQFVNYLLSEKVQSTLSKIGMLSCSYKNLYESGEALSVLESKNAIYTVSPYMDINNLTTVKNLASQTNDIIKVRKLLKHL